MDLKIIRAKRDFEKAGAFSVRITGMNRQHHISLDKEFDELDFTIANHLVILDDTYPIATARFYKLSDDEAIIGRVVVLEEYRGKNIGKLVIDEMEKWIKELGFKSIKVDARVEAIGFYEKLGYKLVDNKTCLCSKTFECIAMRKNI